MQKNLIVIAAVVAIVVIAASAAWIYTGNNTAGPSPTPTPPPASTQEQIRDTAFGYIQTNHTDAGQYLTNLAWTGGRATPEGLIGSETYIYTSGNWNVTITYPVVQTPIYTINATYTSAHANIIWQGTIQNNTVTEICYSNTP